MKKLLFVLLASVTAIFATGTVCRAQPHVLIQLTDDLGSDYSPRINDRGDVVGTGFDGSGTEVFYAALACQADFSSTPSFGMGPLTVHFTDLSACDVNTWSWDFDNDGMEDSSEQNPVHTYEPGGTHTVRLTVSGPNGLDSEVKAHYIRVVQDYSRPAPVMDYAPQEMGIYDTMYEYLTEADCRDCHGSNLSNRHHYAHQGDPCTLCHAVEPQQPEDWPVELGWPPVGPWPPFVDPPAEPIEHNCVAEGCHSRNGGETDPWHHNSDLSAARDCTVCHSYRLVGEFGPGVSFQVAPPKVTPPTPFSCENCHWAQATEPAAPGFVPITSPQGDAGHPSTWEHRDPWGSFVGYWEYGINVSGTQSTHMKKDASFEGECSMCHTVDDTHNNFDPYDPEIIRACERCHTVETLHSIHWQSHGAWEAVGFHTAADSSSIPGAFRLFSSHEMCVGCHGYVPPIPDIRRLKPRSTRPGMVLRIVGDNFGDTQGDSILHVGDLFFDSTSSRIKLWSNSKIKLLMPRFKSKWYKGRDFRRQKVWVTVNGIDSNEKTLKVFRECRCDLNRDGVCDNDDIDLFAADMNRSDCSESGVNCRGDLNRDGVCDGDDADLFMEAYGRGDCKQF